MTLAVVAVLAVVTLAFRVLGASLPERLVRRTSGLAPGLLAALVVTELLSPSSGLPRFDARAAGVAAAVAAAWLHAPVAVTVTVGAAVAAAVRALG